MKGRHERQGQRARLGEGQDIEHGWITGVIASALDHQIETEQGSGVGRCVMLSASPSHEAFQGLVDGRGLEDKEATLLTPMRGWSEPRPIVGIGQLVGHQDVGPLHQVDENLTLGRALRQGRAA